MDRTLTKEQLPAHTHFGSGTSSTGSGGEHTHTASLVPAGGHTHNTSGGAHRHHVADGGHSHPAPFGSSGYIVSFTALTPESIYIPPSGPGARGNLYGATGIAATGVEVTTGDSDHGHIVDSAPDHTHQVVFQQSGGHTHQFPAESTVGSSQPVSVRPASLGVNYFIKI
jgi:hypothetical protein